MRVTKKKSELFHGFTHSVHITESPIHAGHCTKNWVFGEASQRHETHNVLKSRQLSNNCTLDLAVTGDFRKTVFTALVGVGARGSRREDEMGDKQIGQWVWLVSQIIWSWLKRTKGWRNSGITTSNKSSKKLEKLSKSIFFTRYLELSGEVLSKKNAESCWPPRTLWDSSLPMSHCLLYHSAVALKTKPIFLALERAERTRYRKKSSYLFFSPDSEHIWY